MGTKVTLAQLQADASDMFGDYEVELAGGKTLVMRPLLRLDDDQQNEAIKLQAKFQALLNGEVEADNAMGEARKAMHTLLRLVSSTKTQADAFIRAHGKDIVLLLALFNGYREATQPGEANDSSS